MDRKSLSAAFVALLGALTWQVAVAQNTAAPATRAQVKMERDEFLRTHHWDEISSSWVLKQGMEPPTGVMSRAEVKAQRDAFLKKNKWDEQKSQWVPVGPTPREMSSLTREQVRMETAAFEKTHRFDEVSGAWVKR